MATSKTPFSSKCNILRNLLEGPAQTLIEQRQDWADFFEDEAVGLNLAFMVDRGYTTESGLTSNGVAVIESTWVFFCVMIHIDPNDAYRDLDHCIAVAVGNSE